MFLPGMTSAHEQTGPGEKQGRLDDCLRSVVSQPYSDSPRQYPHSVELESLGTQSLWTTVNDSGIESPIAGPDGEQSVALRKKYGLRFCS